MFTPSTMRHLGFGRLVDPQLLRIRDTPRRDHRIPLLNILVRLQVGSQSRPTNAYNGEGDGVEWTLVQHPTPVPPDFAPVAGETCVQVRTDSSTNGTVSIGSGGVSASTTQSYYRVLRPGVVYAMEFWGRADGSADVTLPVSVHFRPSPEGGDLLNAVANLTTLWQRFQFSFTTPCVYNTSGSVQSATLSWSGPGSTVYLDNWRAYEQQTPFMELASVDAIALKESGLGSIRTHAFIKST